MIFPVLVMTRNEGKYLQRCIQSLVDKLDGVVDYKIYIIDNASDKIDQLNFLDRIKNSKIEIVKNKKNLWILGLNQTLRSILNDNIEFFFLTDGDIDFSNTRRDVFPYLIDLMKSNKSLGKIGVSLDWEFIKNDERFIEILKQEQDLYDENKKIGELYISPVDTTAAIYRANWSFSGNSFFYPDHIRYLKPELYSCRTPKNIVVEHLGWRSYFSNELAREEVNQKIKCFTLVSGFIKKEILVQASFHIRIFHNLCWKPINYFWVARRYFFLCRYILIKGRRKFENM